MVEQSGDSWPQGTYVGGRGIGGVLVMVAHRRSPDLAATDPGLDAGRRPEGDPNGCPVDSSSDPVVPGDAMTVCRYDDAGLLEQSELLSGADLKAAELAL